MNKTEVLSPHSEIEKAIEPILEEFELLQKQYKDVIAELQKESLVGEGKRAELGRALTEASEEESRARGQEAVALIQNRNFLGEPSADVSKAIFQEVQKNMTPAEQKQIQLMLQIPNDIRADYKQLLYSAQMNGIKVDDLIETFKKEALEKLAKYKSYLENQ